MREELDAVDVAGEEDENAGLDVAALIFLNKLMIAQIHNKALPLQTQKGR